MTSDHTLKANKFNYFLANVGSKLTQNIGNGDAENVINYLSNPPLINFTFELVSEDDIKELVNNLPSKPSCGHDGISNKLLKACKQEICKPLTLIVNQMLSTGIFPDYLKTAKVIPLFQTSRIPVDDGLIVARYGSITVSMVYRLTPPPPPTPLPPRPPPQTPLILISDVMATRHTTITATDLSAFLMILLTELLGQSTMENKNTCTELKVWSFNCKDNKSSYDLIDNLMDKNNCYIIFTCEHWFTQNEIACFKQRSNNTDRWIYMKSSRGGRG